MDSVRNDNYQGYTMAQQQTQFYTEGADGSQRSEVSEVPPMIQGSRPYVDPNATGEVDPTAYPEPKDATHKIRGRSDILDMFCNNVNQELLIAKTFYFFFFSAFGCLFPLMAIYFKQMGMNPLQTGILIGIRPFVEFIAAPFWGSIADRFKKGKLMLLCSVGSWILFTLAIGFIQPPATSCVVYNGTNHILKHAFSNPVKERSLEQEEYVVPEEAMEEPPLHSHLVDTPGGLHLPQLYHKRSLKQASLEELDEEFLRQMQEWPSSSMPQSHWRRKRDTPLPEDHVIGKSPNVIHYTVNFKDFKGAEEDWLSPPFSSIVYRSSDVQKVFFLLLLVVILGEFFSCPAITLADSAVLTYLGDEADHYGRQRMFGSLGWGLSMFFVGIALDHSTAFPGHPCGPHEKERNYTICFAVFSVLMGCALITASQFKFDYSEAISSTTPEEAKEPIDNGPRPWNEPKIPMQEQKSQRQKLDEAIGTIKTKIFAQTMKEMPQWFVVLREFKNLRCGAFLFVAWWMGFGIGLIFAFLFWHLQDYEGTPTVFGIASVINHISEIFAYFFSFRLIAQIGHVKVLCMGLLGNVLRFLYISWLRDPWWVLPFEFIQGITHAAVWAACCSYIAHNTPLHLRSQSQGVLQGIHHGFGRGSGAIIGGIFVNFFGTPVVFRAYGVVSLIVLAAFIFINFYRKDVGFQPDLPPEEDPHEMAEEGTALAPHGVPANPMPRALSSQKLNEGSGEAGYGTYNATNGMLDIPGGGGTNNPFVQGGGGTTGGGGGGYNYTTQPTPPVFSDTNPFRNFFTPSSPFPSKDSPVTSPDLSPDYESIKNRFQAYNDLLNGRNELKDDSKSLKSPRHTPNLQSQAPQPVTLGHNPQPQATVNDYDW
ncbi:major facilitator superfamily domain-containing protein 6 [Procambarus clarkii]|uniref:major facilitator superfamily domain-containing protein 6 n=1 Tax=Procambarus clarkii TaxID=6728 RepID=UPI001E6738AA|nr:major facilitator superfamily domain-containing protein 6-like [Procambarus clarkii]